MRTTMLSGLLLVVAAFLTVLVGQALDLDVESTALLGVAAGAVVGLVPDATVGRRLAGFALGVVAALIGYFIRAALTPDTATGRAVVIAIVIALCVGIVALSLGKLPFWSVLLGAGSFAGAFEATYVAAPPRVLENSFGGVTTLAMCVAVGFLAVGLIGASTDTPDEKHDDDEDLATTDELLEGTK